MSKATKSKRKQIVPPAEKGSVLHLIDSERFAKVRDAFVRRGYGGLSLKRMAVVVIDEWLTAVESK